MRRLVTARLMRWLVARLGRAFFYAERQLCQVPGFMEAYGAASDAWSAQLDQRVEAVLVEQGHPPREPGRHPWLPADRDGWP